MLVKIRYVKTVVMNTETNEIVSFTETVESENGDSLELGSAVKSKKTSKPKTKVETPDSGKVTLADGKLILTKSIIEKLSAEVGNRISINYVSKNNNYVPVISKSDVFGDAEAGNKLTKSLTVSFKGKQAKSLELHGKEFDLVEDDSLSEGVYLLVDSNFKGLENISENELIELDDASVQLQPETSIDDIIDKSLDESENNINFDFDFGNI